MSPIPAETRDRWSNRAELDSGKGAIYWHILFRDYPAVRATARNGASAAGSVPRSPHDPRGVAARHSSRRGHHGRYLQRVPRPDAFRGTTAPLRDPADQRHDFQGPVPPGGDHAGLHARGCPRSHPPRRTASHAHGNRTNGRHHRACRAMDPPHHDLLQHGQTAHGTHRRCAGTRSATMRHNRKSRQPGDPVGA